jgi:cell division protease FtsH
MFKNLAIWLVIGIVLMTVFNQFNTRQVAQSSMEYSQFIEEVKQGRITKVVIEGRTLKPPPPTASASPATRRPICGWFPIC